MDRRRCAFARPATFSSRPGGGPGQHLHLNELDAIGAPLAPPVAGDSPAGTTSASKTPQPDPDRVEWLRHAHGGDRGLWPRPTGPEILDPRPAAARPLRPTRGRCRLRIASAVRLFLRVHTRSVSAGPEVDLERARGLHSRHGRRPTWPTSSTRRRSWQPVTGTSKVTPEDLSDALERIVLGAARAR